MKSTRIAVIGAGAVGAATAYALTIKNLAAEIMLIDANEQKEAGEVMDIGDTLSLVETGNVRGGTLRDARTADIIILTAGVAQKPEETRLDLLHHNVAITKSIFRSIGKLSRDTIVIVVTNPVDIITYVVQKIVNISHTQVFGTGTTLDSVRLRHTLGNHFQVSSQNVYGYVLGEHGDSEFVAWSTVAVGGRAIHTIPEFSPAHADAIEAQVKKEAYEIIARKGATYFGIATVVASIVEAIALNQQLILPVSSRLDGWNGLNNVCLGLPAIIGEGGIKRLWDISLSTTELTKLHHSAEVIKKNLKSC